MVLTIAKRRFLANLLTSRFIIAAILIEILFISSAAVLIKEYTQRQQQYLSALQEHEKKLKEIHVFAELEVLIDRPPAPLSIFCAGADRRLPTSAVVGHNAAPRMMGGTGEDNPLLSVFSTLDIMTVIQIILSLTVLLFSYNVVSEERERGTLRLVLSNNIPRHVYLAGSFLGGLMSLFLPLLAGFFSTLLLAFLHPFIQLAGSDIMRILLIIPASMLFLTVFYSLGVLFSILMRRSATSLVFLLFIWVFFVMILPSGAVYIARQIRPIESLSVVDQQANIIGNEWEQDMRDYTSKNPAPKAIRTAVRDRWAFTGAWPYLYFLGYAPRELTRWYIDGSIFGHNRKIENENKIYSLYHEYNIRLGNQAELVNQLSRLSPNRVFSRFANIVAGTSASIQLQFMEQAEQYRQRLIGYIREKNGLSSWKLITLNSEDNFLTNAALENLRETQGADALNRVIEQVYSRDKVKALELADLPGFQFIQTRPIDCLYEALPEFIILMLLNILLATGCWVTFLRADVR